MLECTILVVFTKRERERLKKKKKTNKQLTPIVDVGLKAILMFMVSPLDIPPCSFTWESLNKPQCSTKIMPLI